MRFTDEYEQQWEFKGEVGIPKADVDILTRNGVHHTSTDYTRDAYPIVHPVPKEHVFGGIRFQEAGEEIPTDDVFFLLEGGVLGYGSWSRIRLSRLEGTQGAGRHHEGEALDSPQAEQSAEESGPRRTLYHKWKNLVSNIGQPERA